MKLTSVEIHPENSSSAVVLSFRDPRRTLPYNVKKIFGLDADEIIPRYYGASGTKKFYQLSLGKRDIVILVELNPNYSASESYSDLRDAVYRMVASSRTGKIQIQFKNGTEVVAGITGTVKKIEAPQFEKTQEVQITVNCDDKMLQALDPDVVVVAGLNPADTLVQDLKSTAPHGFKFELAITANIANLIISDPNDDWIFTITPIGGFLTGDVLYFSSEVNDKYLYIVRGGVTIHLADVIGPGSIWPILFHGDNHFALTHPTNVVWNAISHFPTYWGV